jgi:DHA1 family tetracycline resistance protein-like MFS transporter
MSRHKPALAFVFITLMLDVLGFGLLIPVAPMLVESLLHGGRGGTEAEAAPIVGLLQATFYAMSFLFAPALGALSDRVGRRPVILISLLGSGLDYLAMALVPTIGWLFVTRVINGITGASFSAVSAYVADVTPPEQRAAGFGMIGAAFGLGFVIGPLLGGSLGAIDIRLPFYVACGLSLANWLYGCFILPESLPPALRSPFRVARANPVGAYAALTRYPLVMGMAGALFLLNMAQFALHATWVLYTSHRYKWTPWDVGLSLFAVGIGAAVVQGGLARRIVPALGERRSLMLGLAIGVASYIAYGTATEGWMIYVIIVVASVGAVAQPAAQALITREVGPTEQGAVQGALASLTSLAGIVGPMLGAWTLALFISDSPPWSGSPIDLQGMNFYVSAALALFGSMIAAWAIRRGGDVGTAPAPCSADAAPTHAPDVPGR